MAATPMPPTAMIPNHLPTEQLQRSRKDAVSQKNCHHVNCNAAKRHFGKSRRASFETSHATFFA
jgi:hypothetical protein